MNVSSNASIFGDLRVLIVDDDEDILSMIQFVLQDIGITRIQQAADGQAAWGFLESSHFPMDLIICDWMMPNMNGLDLLKLVRKRYPDLPFLMLTGKGTLDDVTKARQAGVSAYIVKPFTPDDMHSKIEIMAKKLLKVKPLY